MYQPDTDPSGPPRLNFDVLRLVCNYLSDVPDVLSFALTCSFLTEDALRRRLRMAPVDLWNADKVDSLHAFIFSNKRSPAPCVYGLKITSPSYYGRVIGESRFEIINNRLVAILEAAVRIQYLYFATSISKSVFDTIFKLTTLRELRIFNDMYQGPLIIGLTAFRSPLRSLHIGRSEVAGSIIPASFLQDCLSHLAPTLEFLDLDGFPIDISPSSVTKQYTAVRSLKIQPAFRPDCDVLGVLLRLFPKLDKTLHLGPLNAFITEDDVLPFRERSQEAQKQHSWSGLEQLICDADTAYFIGLQCPIRRLDIEVQTLSAARNLTETLRNHSPRHLSVRLSLYNGFGPLDGLFPAEAVDKLMHLLIFADIEICHGRRSCRRTRGNVPSDRLMNRLLGSIKHLRLSHLRIVSHYTVCRSVRNAKTMPIADSVNTGDGMDLHLTATRLFDAMPTLECLFLTTCGHIHAMPSRKRRSAPEPQELGKWLSSKAWQAVRDNENVWDLADAPMLGSCIELRREAAESVMHETELQLSRHEEDKVRECGGPAPWRPSPFSRI